MSAEALLAAIIASQAAPPAPARVVLGSFTGIAGIRSGRVVVAPANPVDVTIDGKVFRIVGVTDWVDNSNNPAYGMGFAAIGPRSATTQSFDYRALSPDVIVNPGVGENRYVSSASEPTAIGITGFTTGPSWTRSQAGYVVGTEYTVTLEREPPPPPPPGQLLSETLNSVTIAPNRAWGVFNTLNWTFSHGGTDYQIRGWFTDQNGLHIRFANQTQALAFISAGLTVSSGIAGAPDIDSSNMVNLPAIDARTGPVFTQRYANGVDYTVTISE